MRLAASVIALLLLVLAAFASVGCASRAAAATQAVLPAGDGAPGGGVCPVPAGDAVKVALAAGTSEASDTQADHEDGMEAAPAAVVAVGLAALTRVRAGMPVRRAPSPWLGGLLRPPRVLPA